MSFNDCLNDAMAEGSADVERGKRAQTMWSDLADRYERQGHSRENAEGLAGEDVKAAFRREAGESRHTFIATISNNRKLQLEVRGAADEDLGGISTKGVELLDFRARGLKRRFDGLVQDYLDQNHRDIWGKNTDPVNQANFVKEMNGESSGDPIAQAYADSVRAALEDMRLLFNEAGGLIGKLESFGLPHVHNRLSILNAGLDRWAKAKGIPRVAAKAKAMFSGKSQQELFDLSFAQWSDDLLPDIDWSKIEDHLTGRPFQEAGGPAPSPESQTKFLREIFDNIVYGEAGKGAKYGSTKGTSLVRRSAKQRVLHFKSSDGWVNYNKRYGTGDPHKSLMSHVHKMARDVVSMREFGPNPTMGVEYKADLVIEEAKKRGLNPMLIEGGAAHSIRMMRVEQGPALPKGYASTLSANFFANTRQVLTAGLLDRAVVASISDLNSSRMAAKSIGLNQDAPFRHYIKALRDMVSEGKLSTDEMRQMQWIADTQADPGVQAARFNSEIPSAEWAERLSSFVMRAQGLSQHTDAGRFGLQMAFSGQMANQVGKRFDNIEPGLLVILKEHGITAKDWNLLGRPENLYEAGNGSKFLNPMYWRAGTDLAPKVADELFIKFQGAAEDFIEIGVPTQSLFMRGLIDPTAWNMTPGSIPFELTKSAGMFKSFVMAFSYNQFRAIQRLPPGMNKWMFAADSIAGATVTGAVALQVIEILKGNDPLEVNPMDHPDFWAKAAVKGGGLAILGDLVATGQTKWGGGFVDYMAGPVPQVAGDVWKLSVGNLVELGASVLTGTEVKTGFAKESRNFLSRYLPGAQLPVLGPAFDRMVLDQMQILLDPESVSAIKRKSTARQNRDGNAPWWMPGSPAPTRAPNLTTAFGGQK